MKGICVLALVFRNETDFKGPSSIFLINFSLGKSLNFSGVIILYCGLCNFEEEKADRCPISLNRLGVLTELLSPESLLMLSGILIDLVLSGVSFLMLGQTFSFKLNKFII